jgi:hypothetical protein
VKKNSLPSAKVIRKVFELKAIATFVYYTNTNSVANVFHKEDFIQKLACSVDIFK